MNLVGLRKIFPKKSSRHHRSFADLLLVPPPDERLSTLQVPATPFVASDLSRSISNKSITFATVFDDLPLEETNVAPNEIRLSSRMKKSRSAPNLRPSLSFSVPPTTTKKKKPSRWKSTRQWMKSSLIGRWVSPSAGPKINVKNNNVYHPSSELIY